MITPRRTRLVRVPNLQSFRRTIAWLTTEPARTEPSQQPALGPPARSSTIIIVPTSGARRQLERTLGDAHADILTREELYDLLHARLSGLPRRLNAFERDSLAQAAARDAADRLFASTGSDIEEATSRRPSSSPLPFRLRPGLVTEMLRFYDQLRRQSQRLERFNELIEQTLGGGSGDRGADRLLAQTRFLTETFRSYEGLVRGSGGCDEHVLRDHAMRHALTPALQRVIVTVADWIAEPDGLYIGDFDLLARMPGLERIDLVSTEQLLGSEFHERLHQWWPGIEEVNADELMGALAHVRPLLETPRGETDHLWFTMRDREEELVAVAQHVWASQRAATAAHADVGSVEQVAARTPIALEKIGVVFKHPLPYLYLAAGTLGVAEIAYDAADAMPLAGEPWVATVDLVLDTLESTFSREALVALLGSPHLVIGSPAPSADAVRALDLALRERAYIGERERLEALATSWTVSEARPALDAALHVARELEPLLETAPASAQLRRLAAFLTARARPFADDDPFREREVRARAATFELLHAVADAHLAHHDPDWTIAELASAVRRWIEEQTFSPTAPSGAAGVQLLDDRAARYGDFDDLTIVGLIENDWPERQARHIFYPSGLLKALGWPSERTRRRASDARFVDLLSSASRRVSLSTITLDDEAIVMRSMQLDEIPRARLSSVRTTDQVANITAAEALSAEPATPIAAPPISGSRSAALDALPPASRAWAEQRMRRTSSNDSRFHGDLGVGPQRTWSVSALEVYLACPFKFYAQHVLRVDEEPDDSDVMNPRQQGQFVHAVFERFFEVWQESGNGAITPENLDAARGAFGAVAEEQLKQLPEVEAGLERTRLLGSSAAAGLGEAVIRMEAERPVRVVQRLLEERLDGPIAVATRNGPRVVDLRGKADRIDLLEDDTFRLVDYKLGWPPQRARALQLPMYALAAQQRLRERSGRAWRLGEAVYLAFKGPRRVVPLCGPQSDQAKVLAEAQQRVADTLDAIDRGWFPPTPDDVFLCESCSFGAVCRKDYIGV